MAEVLLSHPFEDQNESDIFKKSYLPVKKYYSKKLHEIIISLYISSNLEVMRALLEGVHTG
jgi:hypothetical protein